MTVFGDFLKIKTVKETDIILSRVYNSFPMQIDTSKSYNWDAQSEGFQKLAPPLIKHDLHDVAEVNQNFEQTHFDKKDGFSSKIDFVLAKCDTI